MNIQFGIAGHDQNPQPYGFITPESGSRMNKQYIISWKDEQHAYAIPANLVTELEIIDRKDPTDKTASDRQFTYVQPNILQSNQGDRFTFSKQA